MGTFSNQMQQITPLFDKLFISYKGDFLWVVKKS